MTTEIKIKRNGNEITITPNFEKKHITTNINGKKFHGLHLNEKNQFLSQTWKIGVQLDENQAQEIKNWIKQFKSLEEQEDEEKRDEIKNKEVKTVSFKFHNYLIERYIHTESVELSNHETIYSEEGHRIMNALHILSLEQLDKLGIKREDGYWQEIKVTDEDKKWILEQAAVNEKKINEKIETENKERKQKEEKLRQEKEAKKEEALNKAVETGEKQLLSTSSAMADDGNLVIITKYIHPDGHVSTDEFYDGD